MTVRVMKRHLIYVTLTTLFIGSVVALPKECKGGLPGKGCRHACGSIWDKCPTGYSRQHYNARHELLPYGATHQYAYCICYRPWNEAEAKEIAQYNCDNSAHTYATDRESSAGTLNIAGNMTEARCETLRIEQWCVNRTRDYPKHPGTRRMCKLLAYIQDRDNAPCDEAADKCVGQLPNDPTLAQLNGFVRYTAATQRDKKTEYNRIADELFRLNETQKDDWKQVVLKKYELSREHWCNLTVSKCEKIRLEDKCKGLLMVRGRDDWNTKRLCRTIEQRFELDKEKRRYRADNAGKEDCPNYARDCIAGLHSLSEDHNCGFAARCSEEELIFWCSLAKDNITQNPEGVTKICDVLAKKQGKNGGNADCDNYLENRCEVLNHPVYRYRDITINETKVLAEVQCGEVATKCTQEKLEHWCRNLTGKYADGIATKHVCTAAGIHELQKAGTRETESSEPKAVGVPKGKPIQNGRAVQKQRGRGIGAKCDNKGKHCTQGTASTDKKGMGGKHKDGDEIIDALNIQDGLLPDVNLANVTDIGI